MRAALVVPVAIALFPVFSCALMFAVTGVLHLSQWMLGPWTSGWVYATLPLTSIAAVVLSGVTAKWLVDRDHPA